jgi:hypothetical protein
LGRRGLGLVVLLFVPVVRSFVYWGWWGNWFSCLGSSFGIGDHLVGVVLFSFVFLVDEGIQHATSLAFSLVQLVVFRAPFHLFNPLCHRHLTGCLLP